MRPSNSRVISPNSSKSYPAVTQDTVTVSLSREPGGVRFHSFTLVLFILILAYTAIPLVDIPLIGLSLSAPLFFLVALEVFFRPPRPWFKRYRGWIWLASLIWLGLTVSALLNGLLSEGVAFDKNGALTVIRYAYWLLTFVVTVYLVSEARLGRRVSNGISWAILGVGLLRWLEVVVWGKIGAWTNTIFFTQNTYGILFSTFAAFLLAGVMYPGPRRWRMTLSLLIVWSAAAVNGSRGSWVGLVVGLIIFMILYTLGTSNNRGVLIVFILLATLLLLGLTLAPKNIVAAVSQRYATFQSLEEEKSFAIRELMLRKGWLLFQTNPILGVGPGRWRVESVPLELPPILRYAAQEHFDLKSSHNSYVAFLAEGGLITSIPFAMLLVIIFLRGLKATLVLARRQEYWALGAYAGVIGLSVHLWALTGLTSTSPWVMYGLVGAIIVQAGQKFTSPVERTPGGDHNSTRPARLSRIH